MLQTANEDSDGCRVRAFMKSYNVTDRFLITLQNGEKTLPYQ
jgi:hypothetical protein